jgi:DNA-binding transcriptional LysR family regulator
MILKQLSHLLALAKERHFGKAARQAGVSQPGLSASLKHLEDSLGVPLVQRDHRFSGFTAEGQTVLGHARRIQAEIDALHHTLSEMRDGVSGRLRLGAIPTALPIVSCLTAPFFGKYPKVRISVMSMTSDEIISRMDEFNLDAGITYLDNEPLAGVKAVPLYTEEYVLLVPMAGRFEHLTRATWAEAAAQPLCLLTPDMQNRRIIDGIFRSIGCAPEPSVETNSIFNLCSHVAAGHWCSVVPKPLLHFFGQPLGTRVLDLIEPQVTRTIGLIVADREPQSPLAARLMALARTINVADQMAGPIRPPVNPAHIDNQ